MFIKESADPVGKTHKMESVEVLLQTYMRIWNQSKQRRAWIKFDSSKITNFLMKALDDFIVAVDESGMLGPDKKATVLFAVARLYDYVVREGMPVWMAPFAGVVKQYVIYVLISNSIDWIVSKYKEGGWKPRKMYSWETKKAPCRRRSNEK